MNALTIAAIEGDLDGIECRLDPAFLAEISGIPEDRSALRALSHIRPLRTRDIDKDRGIAVVEVVCFGAFGGVDRGGMRMTYDEQAGWRLSSELLDARKVFPGAFESEPLRAHQD